MNLLSWYQLSVIILKLTNLINWAWWQVLIPLELLAVIFVIALACKVTLIIWAHFDPEFKRMVELRKLQKDIEGSMY